MHFMIDLKITLKRGSNQAEHVDHGLKSASRQLDESKVKRLSVLRATPIVGTHTASHHASTSTGMAE